MGGDPVPDGETPESDKPTAEGADDSSAKMEEEEEEEEESLPGCTLFIKNLNFSTTEETLKGVSSDLGCGVGPRLLILPKTGLMCMWGLTTHSHPDLSAGPPSRRVI